MKLARDSLLNLIGLGLPLCLAVVLVPQLLSGLGADRFGLLGLIWALTSYFGLFDLGLGRALTQQLAALDGRADADADANAAAAQSLSATALMLIGLFGLLGGALLWVLAGDIPARLQGVPDAAEATRAIRHMAWGLPFIVLTAGLRGILEARHRFGPINRIRIPMGIWTFFGPWLTLRLFGPALDHLTLALVAGRVVACVWHARYAWQTVPGPVSGLRWDAVWLRPLCTTGGWMTLSNVVSPFMGYVDRFLIGGMLSAAAVAYYVSPQELVVKLSIFPAAVTAVLLPGLAQAWARRDSRIWVACERALWAMGAVMALTALPLALFAREVLQVWLGPEMAAASTLVMRIFCLGITINCLAQIPFTFLQGTDDARATALLHLLELPLFLLALGLCISQWGIAGAALAWLLRMTADTGALFHLTARRLGVSAASLLPRGDRWRLLALFAGFGACASESGAVRLGALVLVALAQFAGQKHLLQQLKGPWSRQP